MITFFFLRCLNHSMDFLPGRPLFCHVNENLKHEQNVLCCSVHLCNLIVPELAPVPQPVNKQNSGILFMYRVHTQDGLHRVYMHKDVSMYHWFTEEAGSLSLCVIGEGGIVS